MNDPKTEIVQDTLATEMLKEIKATSRRWFIAFITVLCLWFATIIGFILYEYYSLPVEETTTTQTVDDIDNSDIRQIIGGDDNGESETDSTQGEKRP